MNSLGVFPGSRYNSLSSFAGTVSSSNSSKVLANASLPDLLSRRTHSRQATLSQAQMCTKVQVSSCFVTHLCPNTEQNMRYNNRSPRKLGRGRHAVAVRPKTLTPSTNPRLAAKACTRNFIDVPYNGFLGPSWELPEPTRILHHLLLPNFYGLSNRLQNL